MNEQPILVWVTGILETMSFYASTADNIPGTAIAIKLLRQVDREALAALKNISKPPPPEFDHIFRTSKIGNKPTKNITLFSEVYDACVAFTDKSLMHRIPTSSLVAALYKTLKHNVARTAGALIFT
ncbi:hypothetical protein BN946_scf184768.g7 [Trametes cinnabarina]|uniref:Uncharacterized protein n=1 Tax=Pycnoporus cinnabarinus TaxID=5643 RepID=A0A060SNF0_PYCCI|nr:hypothetical protein BN946_scf184768.g7 [Trametes cinnabarina]